MKRLRFNVNGTSGTTGFCNVTVPAELISGDFSLYIDDTTLLKNVDYTEDYNGTHYIFSIKYENNDHIVELVSTIVIPESASWLFLPFAMSVTLLALALGKKLKNNEK